MNNEIEQQASQIAMLNKTLAQNLDEVSKDLLLKNQKLAEYAFYNSHETRAPLARLLGLVAIFNNAKTEKERQLYLNKISDCAKELDSIVKKMNYILIETGFFKNEE